MSQFLEVKKLVHNDNQQLAGDFSISVDRDLVAVGVGSYNTTRGKVWIFRQNKLVIYVNTNPNSNH